MSFNVLSALIEWLETSTNWPTYMRVPEDRPEEFITVRRAGGSASLGKDSPAIEILVWAESDLDAYTKALEVRDLMIYNLAAEISEVCKATVSSLVDYRYSTDIPCWQVSAILITRL